MNERVETLRCSFCAKSQHEVRALIGGPTVFICDACVVDCLIQTANEFPSTVEALAEGICKALMPVVGEQSQAFADLLRRKIDARLGELAAVKPTKRRSGVFLPSI